MRRSWRLLLFTMVVVVLYTTAFYVFMSQSVDPLPNASYSPEDMAKVLRAADAQGVVLPPRKRFNSGTSAGKPGEEKRKWSDIQARMQNVDNPIVYFDVDIGGKRSGRVVFELFAHIVPKTAENFRALCTGEGGPWLTYKNSTFHRVIPGFVAQGGDFPDPENRGKSIYGHNFEDENFVLKHDRPGLLSMANYAPNTNANQFFITYGIFPHLDGHHVVFGQVLDGLASVLRQVEAVGTQDGSPTRPVVIVDSGQLSSADFI